MRKTTQVGHSRQMALDKCLECGATHNGAFQVGGDGEPSPGDITICIHCGHMMAFDEDLRFRELSEQEALDARENEDAEIALLALRDARKSGGW